MIGVFSLLGFKFGVGFNLVNRLEQHLFGSLFALIEIFVQKGGLYLLENLVKF